MEKKTARGLRGAACTAGFVGGIMVDPELTNLEKKVLQLLRAFDAEWASGPRDGGTRNDPCIYPAHAKQLLRADPWGEVLPALGKLRLLGLVSTTSSTSADGRDWPLYSLTDLGRGFSRPT